MLFDNYLVVSQWSPGFASCTAKVKKKWCGLDFQALIRYFMMKVSC